MTRVTGAHASRLLWFLAAPALCLIVFWRVPLTWFLTDDFAWLGVPLEVHNLRDFWHIMFVPKAQGTVRVLSERLFFFVFSSLFGLNALPYRLWVLATWFANLTLASLIGARLTGLRAAGFLAAVLWTVHANIATPLMWTSAYNEVLCAFFLLLAFYARLRWMESGQRKWMVTEWAAFLAGFGALEIVVMYPAIIFLHALCVHRKRIWKTLPYFAPSVAFLVLRLYLVPLNAGPYYTPTVDGRLPGNFLRYLAWAIGPGRVGDPGTHTRPRDLAVVVVTGVALAAFVWWRLRRKELASLFCLGWFVLLLAPVLPLPNHLEQFYVTLPVLGLAWLGGWGIAAGWRAGWVGRVIPLVLAGYYLWGSVKEANVATRWFLERSERMEVVMLGLQEAVRRHPGSAFLLQGVTSDLFNSGFQDNPFRLLGSERVYLAPGTEEIQGRADLGGPAHYLISPATALNLLDRGEARVLSVSAEGLHDITTQYKTMLRSDPAVLRRDFVDAGDARSDPFLGPTWYPADQGFRWMPKTATVKFSGPFPASAKLYVTGYAPASVLASGPVTLSFHAAGHPLGSATLRQPDQMFALEFPMPAGVAGQTLVEISVEVDKVFRPANEQRELGMVFGTFGIR